MSKNSFFVIEKINKVQTNKIQKIASNGCRFLITPCHAAGLASLFASSQTRTGLQLANLGRVNESQSKHQSHYLQFRYPGCGFY